MRLLLKAIDKLLHARYPLKFAALVQSLCVPRDGCCLGGKAAVKFVPGDLLAFAYCCTTVHHSLTKLFYK